MKLRFTPRASQDIAEIADYIRASSQGSAIRVRKYLLAKLENLLIFPLAGRAQDVPGVRKFVTPRWGYIIYYTLDEVHDELIVVSVQHPKRKRDFQDE